MPRHLARPRSRRARTVTALSVAGAVTVGALALVSTGGAPAAGAATTASTCPLTNSYGRMFPSLASASWSFDDLNNLSEAIIEQQHAEPAPGQGLDDEMDDVPAGYTYVGQFLDLDMTKDPRPNDLLTPVTPASLTNARTPQFDLDSMYGKGPTGSPAEYEADGVHFKLGAPLTGAALDPNAHDLVRNAAGVAVVGDGREDENRLVGSFYSIMTRFHNAVADDIARAHPDLTGPALFAATRQLVTWYYQYAALNDFLPHIVQPEVLHDVVERDDGRWKAHLRFYNPCNGSMPVEFSGATYRFGHSMVREDYQINAQITDLPVFTPSTDPRANVGGFQPSPPDFAVDWGFLFNLGGTSPAHAYRIDNSLVSSLRLIPGQAAGTASTILSTRNLLRGQQLGLPSGQAVARAMNVRPLADDQIIIGPALGPGYAGTEAITDVSKSFAGNSPLWSYVLAEAVNRTFTVKGGHIVSAKSDHFGLGPVGSRIVSEVFVGLMQNDPNSILNHPEFRPVARFASSFTFADIVRKGTGLDTTPLS